MILTGSVLLLALVGAVRPYPFGNNQQPSGAQGFGYNQAMLHQSQPFTSMGQPQFYANQNLNNNIQLNNNNAQRFYQQQQQQQSAFQSPRFFAGAQQQHSIQQRQVPSAPTRANQHIQINYAGSINPQQQQQQAQLAPTNLQTRLAPAAPAIPSDKDFLSSLQIIDTQGRLRELRDFGLGGAGAHPEEPELERQLKTIFETINRDLENAAFLPLDMNTAGHQQLSSIFQTNQYNREPVKRLPLVSESNERPRQPQQVDPRGYLQQQPPTQTQPQPQHQKQQFQFLQPARTNKGPDAPIRSPAQTLRDARNLHEKKSQQLEQRPIEQAPLKQEPQAALPVKSGPAPIEQQRIQQEPIQQAPIQQQQLDNSKGYQNSYKAPVAQVQHREPETKTRQHPQQETKRVALNQAVKQREEPVGQHRTPVEQQQIAIPAQPERKTAQIEQQQQQQQQQQGFDDEPEALKKVERDQPAQTKETSLPPRQRPVDSFKQVFRPREKAPIVEPAFDSASISQAPIQQQQIEEIQQQQQQIQRQEPIQQQQEPIQLQPIALPQLQQQQLKQDVIEEDELPLAPASNLKTNSNKYDGWVPIVQKQEPVLEQQRLIEPQAQLPLEQVREEPGFDVQRPTIQQSDVQIEQQTLQQVDQQQRAPREHGRFNKIIKSSKFTSPDRSAKLTSGNNNAGFQVTDSQQQQQEVISDQGQQQQREEVPVQQQEEALALVVEQQRQDLVQQQEVKVGSGGSKQEQAIKTEQRRVEPGPVVIPTIATTLRPAQRNESVKGGRKVKLQQVEKVRTPVQKARDQQTKIIKQQQQRQQEQQFQQLPQQLPTKANEREAKRPRQLQPAAQLARQEQQSIVKQEELQQVKEETQGQTKFEEPGTPVITTFRQTPRNQEQKRQQELIKEHREDSIELPQQRPEFTQQQQQQPEEQVRVQDDLTQQKEELSQQQKVEVTELIEDSPQTKKGPSQQPREEQVQQKEEQRVEDVQQKVEPVQQSDETVQEKFDQTQQQQQKQEEPTFQQKEEIEATREEPAQQKVEVASGVQQKEKANQQTDKINQQTEEGTQQREDSPKRNEEPSRVIEDLPQQNEDLSQQKEEIVQQQQPQEAPLLEQQQQKQEEQVQQLAQQQQESSADQAPRQQQEVTSQQPDNVQQLQTQEDNNQFQQPQQQVSLQEQTRQEEGTSEQQPTPVQEDEKRQDEQQIKQTEETFGLEKQQKLQVSELPQRQIQDEKAQVDEELTPTTTTRPPTRLVRPLNQRKESKAKLPEIKQEAKEETSQEVVAPTTRPKSRFNHFERHSARIESQKQNSEQPARGRFVNRQRNDETNNSGTQKIDRYNNEGYLSAHQLLNTYNPLQFEPERISSLNRASESSSQNTNVNSSPSGDSY